MTEQSVYIVKPEAFAHRDEIRRRIAERGICVIAFAEVTLPTWVGVELYPEAPAALLAATARFLCHSPVEMGAVRAENALRRLEDLVGHDVNPVRCTRGTLRFRFGERNPDRTFGVAYFFNGIHCSRSANEVGRDLAIFARLNR